MITVVGEAVVDIVTTAGRSLRYPGGSPANVAVGLARLGIEAQLLTQVGTDGNGDLIAAHLAGNGVALIQPRGAQPPSVAEVTIGTDGKPSYQFEVTWTLGELTSSARATISQATCVHIGSVAATLSPGAETVRALVESVRAGATISYDPNCRPMLMGDVTAARGQIESLVACSDVVKVSDEDLRWLYPEQPDQDAATQWLSFGPSLVIVTRGAAGAWACSADRVVSIGAVDTEVVDTVGAGDSFMAAVLAGLADRDLLGAGRRAQLARIDESSLTDLLEFAARAAAITCGRAGADPPTRAELLDR
jgi:fructokinase